MINMGKLLGTICIEITSVEPLSLIDQMIRKGIAVLDVKSVDVLNIQIVCEASEYSKVRAFLRRNNNQYRIIQKNGWRWGFGSILRRWTLMAGIGLVLFATVLLSTRVLFIQVTGNSVISSETILDAAQNCGIQFFAPRKQVRSEKMKNALLNTLPQLQWAGINTSGCVATIQVKEKKGAEGNLNQYTSGNIVAHRDGIIYSCTVREGELLCRVGQAVQKEQILVSGYRDNGLFVSKTVVDAEIYGVTNRDIFAVALCSSGKRSENGEESVRYGVRIGKKIINLSKGSGISPGTCVKIYTEKYLSLPGGFRLPISIIQEKTVRYAVQLELDDSDMSYGWLRSYGREYISQQMIAGEIIHQQESIHVSEDICLYRASFACVELIGKNKLEGIVKRYGENE